MIAPIRIAVAGVLALGLGVAPTLAAEPPEATADDQTEATRAASEAFRKMIDTPLKDIVGEGTMRDRMAKADPDMPEKMIIAQGVMLEGMMGMMARMKAIDVPEPPAGASEDDKMDAAMARMREVLPAMMDAMPDMVSKVRERTAHLDKDAGPAPEAD